MWDVWYEEFNMRCEILDMSNLKRDVKCIYIIWDVICKIWEVWYDMWDAKYEKYDMKCNMLYIRSVL